MTKNVVLYNEDCIQGSKQKLKESSVDLLITDPPFGLGESKFEQHYKRNKENIVHGYVEAPENYYDFTYQWLLQARRVVNKDGSIYIIIGHTPLLDVLTAAQELGLVLRNHIIWKYNFGVYTKKKFVTSHYHILYYTKPKARPTFNTNCRFGPNEKFKTEDGRELSKLYNDLEDVWIINKEFIPNKEKNQNKLPEELLRKIILYSSNPGDVVADFFMGNFTTAYAALKLGRKVIGFEINKNMFDIHYSRLKDLDFGCDLKHLPIIESSTLSNQGKPLSIHEKYLIYRDVVDLVSGGVTKKEATRIVGEKYGRGKFSIKNVVDYFEKS